MKYAFFPGCVSRGACPELFVSTMEVCSMLGIELDYESMKGASCTGSGILQEKNQKLGDTLNARNFALAEKSGNPLLTICSTCQGVMSQANKRMKDNPEYLKEINESLAEEGLEYSGKQEPKHLLWAIIEDIGIDKLKSLVKHPLKGLKFAPFYGCFIVRPSTALDFSGHPERETSLETVIEAVGAEVTEFEGKNLCCGFPILMINESNSVNMVAKHTDEAKNNGADAMVTPCPLCHLNLDGYQPQASKAAGHTIGLPILHLPQMLGLSLGIDPKALKLNRHIISSEKILSLLFVKP